MNFFADEVLRYRSGRQSAIPACEIQIGNWAWQQYTFGVKVTVIANANGRQYSTLLNVEYRR
jgi:hypothetical protein